MSHAKLTGNLTSQPHSMPELRQDAYYVDIGWQPPIGGRLGLKRPLLCRQEDQAVAAVAAERLHQQQLWQPGQQQWPGQQGGLQY